MAAIKRFFEKRKMDIKFKKAGDGHKLTENTRSREVASSSRDPPPPAIQRHASTGAAQTAAQAALARSDQKKPGPAFGTSSAAIKAQVRQEMEAQKKRETDAYRLAETYSAPKEVNLEASPILAVSGVYFKSPVTGDVVLPRVQMQEHIKEFLYAQLGEEPQMTAALMIYTLNNDPDKVKVCVETLCKYLDNIINNPGEEKYCKIRVQNKAFQDRVCSLEGTEIFLQAAGFQHKSLPGPNNDQPEDYLVMNAETGCNVETLKNLKEILVTAEAIRPELDRNTKVYLATGSETSHRMQVPQEFYNISPEELKREQDARTEAVERLGMLRTKEMRERERLRELRRYRYCLIRVRFPDGVILQGTFRANDKIATVMEFVRENLELEWVPFKLTGQTGVKYTNEDAMLCESDLTPAAILHFAFDSSVMAEITAQRGGMKLDNYINVDLLAKAVSL